MKTTILISILLTIIVISGYSQVPEAFNYQSVIRNSSGEVLSNQDVSFRISILQNTESGPAVYVETHTYTTNSFGLANLKIGKGTLVSGIFNPGGWGTAPHFIKIEFDPSGGNSFEVLGTSQLLSVPYAFHAKTVENDEVNDADADPTNEIQSINISGTQLTLSKGGGSVTLPSSDGENHWQSSGSDIYYNQGQVGIGITNPYSDLEIKNDGDVSRQKFFTATSGTTVNDGFSIGLYKSSLTAELFNHENGDILFGTNSTNRMSIKADGNIYIYNKVGIGVLYPNYNLELKDNGDVCRQKFFTTASGSTVNDGLSVALYNTLDAELFNHENGDMVFGTNSAQRMRIYADGNIYMNKRLLVGSYGIAAAGLQVKGTGYPDSFIFIEATTGNDAGFRLYEGTTAKWHMFNNAAAGGLQIYNTAGQTAIFAKQSNSFIGIGTTNPTQALHVVGNAYKTDGGTSWATSSDIRLKNVLGTYSKGLEKILSLQPVRYVYKKDNPRQLNSTEIQVGFVAQEVQKIFPEAVTEGEDGFLDFNIHSINVAMVNAIKELNNENQQLKNRVEDLENRLNKMESYFELSASKK